MNNVIILYYIPRKHELIYKNREIFQKERVQSLQQCSVPDDAVEIISYDELMAHCISASVDEAEVVIANYMYFVRVSGKDIANGLVFCDNKEILKIKLLSDDDDKGSYYYSMKFKSDRSVSNICEKVKTPTIISDLECAISDVILIDDNMKLWLKNSIIMSNKCFEKVVCCDVIIIGLTTDKEVWIYEITKNIFYEKLVFGLTHWVDIAAGSQHYLLLNSDNEVFSYGDNTLGQLGGTNNNRVNTRENVKKIFAGANNSAFITDNNTVFTFGKSGTLGYKSIKYSSCPNPVRINRDTTITKVMFGNYHTGFITDGNCLYQCGAPGYDKLLVHSNGNAVYEPKLTTFKDVSQCICTDVQTIILSTNGDVHSYGGTKNNSQKTLLRSNIAKIAATSKELILLPL